MSVVPVHALQEKERRGSGQKPERWERPPGGTPLTLTRDAKARAMGRKKNRLPPFVAIFKDMLKSDAWEVLSNAARVAYLHLKSKQVSQNNDEITLSFKEMERIMNRHTFSRSIKQLEQYGFIMKEQRGGLYRRRNFYRLSEQWKNSTKQ